jgi:hypothetical protein
LLLAAAVQHYDGVSTKPGQLQYPATQAAANTALPNRLAHLSPCWRVIGLQLAAKGTAAILVWKKNDGYLFR